MKYFTKEQLEKLPKDIQKQVDSGQIQVKYGYSNLISDLAKSLEVSHSEAEEIVRNLKYGDVDKENSTITFKI